MKALILSGGGALGAFEAGVVKAFKDRGESFDLVCGTSIGAMNAAFVAQDKADELMSLWQGISKVNVIQYVTPIQYAIMLADEIEKVDHDDPFALIPAIERWMQVGSKKALLALRGVVKPDSIEQLLNANLDLDMLKRSLIVTATNLTYGSSDAFFAFVGEGCDAVQSLFEKAIGSAGHALSTTQAFRDAVRASAAIPGFFEPVTLNLGSAGNKEFVDGGVANNTPVRLASMAGASEIVVVLLEPAPPAVPSYATETLAEIALASYTVVQQQLLQLDVALAASRGAAVTTIRPSAALSLSLLGFNDQAGINAAFSEGYKVTGATP